MLFVDSGYQGLKFANGLRTFCRSVTMKSLNVLIESLDLGYCSKAGRPQSASFFTAEFLGVDELPHRTIIDLVATLSELGHQPAHGKILPAPLHQPVAVWPRNLLWPIAADLVRLDAAGVVEALYPVDRRADAHPNWAAA